MVYEEPGLGLCDLHAAHTWPELGTLPQSKDDMSTELGRDPEAIAGMLWHNVHTTWFDFHAGSRLVHLCFSILFRTMARDGVPVWFKCPGPTTREAQPHIADAGIRIKAKEKIAKVLRRRYLVTTGINIRLLINYFVVPMGKDNVRIVYNTMANELNECVWVPTFWLPTIDLLVRALDEHSWMTDQDVGDMFFELPTALIHDAIHRC